MKYSIGDVVAYMDGRSHYVITDIKLDMYKLKCIKHPSMEPFYHDWETQNSVESAKFIRSASKLEKALK